MIILLFNLQQRLPDPPATPDGPAATAADCCGEATTPAAAGGQWR